MVTSVQCLPEMILLIISSLPIPDANFQEAKSDYLGLLLVTPEMVAKTIKAMKVINQQEWMVFLQNY